MRLSLINTVMVFNSQVQTENSSKLFVFFHLVSSQGSHTSKYFGSIDSSENDHSRKQPAGGSSSAGGDGGEEQFIKCVLQDPIWLLMANTDDKVMMTYQLPVRYSTGKNDIHDFDSLIQLSDDKLV